MHGRSGERSQAWFRRMMSSEGSRARAVSRELMCIRPAKDSAADDRWRLESALRVAPRPWHPSASGDLRLLCCTRAMLVSPCFVHASDWRPY